VTEREYSHESADLNGLLLHVFRRIPEASCADAIGRARNLLGEEGCRRLLADIETEKRGEPPQRVAEAQADHMIRNSQSKLFD